MNLSYIENTAERLVSRKSFYNQRSQFCSKAEAMYHQVEQVKLEINLLKEILEYGRESFLVQLPYNIKLRTLIATALSKLASGSLFNHLVSEQRWYDAIEYLQDDLTEKQALLDRLEQEELDLEGILYGTRK
jgi:hypothetical protein